MPEPYIPKTGARIMGLNDPDTKMSKSIPEGCVFLMEKPEDIQRKFKRAITDSDTERCVRFDPENKPGVSNLMSIYSAVTGKTFEEIEAEFDGQGYGAFKPAVGDAVVEMPASHPGGGPAALSGQGLPGECLPGRRGEGLLCGEQDPAQGL